MSAVPGLRGICRKIVALGAQKGLTVGTAESLTGGMIASALAGIPGASQVLMGGIVSYDPHVKHDLLGVPQSVIDGVGVVSEPCARQMCIGAKACLHVDVAVSATGLAGPGGATAETPVGTVFIGVVGRGEARVIQYHFTGGRQTVRRKAARAALQMIYEEMNQAV